MTYRPTIPDQEAEHRRLLRELNESRQARDADPMRFRVAQRRDTNLRDFARQRAVRRPRQLTRTVTRLYSPPWLPQLQGTSVADTVETFRTYPGGAYGDAGQWALLHGMIHGDWTTACEGCTKALEAQTHYLETSNDRNHTREAATFFAYMGLVLWPHLTAAQKATWLSKLTVWRDHMLAYSRLGDSDEVVGHYFGLLLIAKVLGESPDGYVVNPGGYSMTEMREVLLGYVEWARGGEWLEGSSYNLGTSQLLLMGALFDGLANWPEIVAWARECLLQRIFTTSADRTTSAVWGDGQRREVSYHSLLPLTALCLAVGGDPGFPEYGLPPGCGAEFLAEIMIPPGPWQFTYARMLLACNPLELPKNPPKHLPVGFKASGVGLFVYRSIDKEGVHWMPYAFMPTTGEWVDHNPQHTLPAYAVWNSKDGWRSEFGGFGAYIPSSERHNTTRAGGVPFNGPPNGTYIGFSTRTLLKAAVLPDGFIIEGECGGHIRGSWASWHGTPFLKWHRSSLRWDDPAKRWHIHDAAEFFEEPPIDDPASKGWTYAQEQAAIKSAKAKLERLAYGGDVVSEDADSIVDEPGGVRLLKDGFPLVEMSTTVGYVATPADPPEDPPVVEPPPKPDVDVEFCGALLAVLLKGQAEIKTAVEQVLDNQRESAKAVK